VKVAGQIGVCLLACVGAAAIYLFAIWWTESIVHRAVERMAREEFESQIRSEVIKQLEIRDSSDE
jgi:hypothetical protein